MNVDFLLILIFFFIIGLCVGSFINVVISRLPVKGAFLGKKRSECPFCEVPIKAYDLIPVLSFIILKGKCRNCGAIISPRYPLVELLCALFACFSFIHYGLEPVTGIAFAFTAVLLAISVIDLDTSEIPDSLVISIGVLAIASIWLIPEIGLINRLIGMVVISVPMLLVAMAVKGAFGGGDIKLMAACGFLLGWQCTILAFFIALLTGGSYAIYLMLSGKRDRKEHMVFGPAICIGAAVSFFYGVEIISWYLHLFMLY